MEEAVGVAIPHQLQFRREVLIALPELEQHREKGRDGNAAGKIRPRKARLLDAAQLDAGFLQFSRRPSKRAAAFVVKVPVSVTPVMTKLPTVHHWWKSAGGVRPLW